MFTGIVEQVGEITSRTTGSGSVAFGVAAPVLASSLDPGDSIAVDGVCLTVTTRGHDEFTVDAVAATLVRTTLDGWEPGRRVNLERAVALGRPLGGHLVQGHVDGIGTVARVIRKGEDVRVAVEVEPSVLDVTVERGSLAVDGVSLTVARLDEAVAQFALIPYTWSHTTLHRLEPGSRVNVEADLIGKYVRRLIEPYRTPAVTTRDLTE